MQSTNILISASNTDNPTDAKYLNQFVFEDKNNESPKKDKNNRVIMHIDMNSYFASVAQQYDKSLRNKPIAVMGKGKGTVVIAASKEAKRFGIKTGTNKDEAIKLYPDIVFVSPDFGKYVITTGKILEVFNEFTPSIEPFSIDEAFLDITDTHLIKNLSPVEIGYRIKRRIIEEVGEVMTCSVGIATNKLMAKFASDLQKPDGLIYLKPHQYISVLDKYPLVDICGIGRQTIAHLERMNIYTIKDLRSINYTILKSEFGPINGRFLYHAARGQDYSKVDPKAFYEDPKSLSHSETFTENKSGDKLNSDIYKLCEKVSLRLRKKELFCKCVHLYIKDTQFNTYEYKQNLFRYTNNTIDIFNAIVKQIPQNFVSRFVCIYAVNLNREKNSDLFDIGEKQDNLQIAMDKINLKYGHFMLMPASVTKPVVDPESPIDVPFSGLDMDAKTGMNILNLAKKNLDITKEYIKNNMIK